MTRCRLLQCGVAALPGLLLGAVAPPPPSRVASSQLASAPSTQPVIGSCVNEASVEFASRWSSFRFASQSNPVTVELTAPATRPAEVSPPAQPPLPTGTSQVQTDRGSAAPAAVHGHAEVDAIRGSARADAIRGNAVISNVRGAAVATASRGTYTVQILRGDARVIAARQQNSSAVVRPDLSVALKASPAVAAPGDIVVYTITIKNISSIEARDVTISDYLPERLAVLSAEGATVVADPDDSSTHLTVAGSIAPGRSIDVQLVAKVKTSPANP